METIEVSTKSMGDITLYGFFNDGVAHLTCEQDEKEYEMRYPKLSQLTAEQAWQIYEYCGRPADEPFDVALKFGVLYDKEGKEIETCW